MSEEYEDDFEIGYEEDFEVTFEHAPVSQGTAGATGPQQLFWYCCCRVMGS
jgi:hypothetical protein